MENVPRGVAPAALYLGGMSSRSLFLFLNWLSLLLPLAAHAQAPSGGQPPQTGRPTAGIPTFYANARQVIVEADVSKPVDKKHPDTNWMPQGTLDGAPAAAAGIEKSMPPPARGLTASDFHVFDNGAEQSINYFKESDFPATGTGQWILHPTAHGIWGSFVPAGPGVGVLPSATYLIGYVPPAPQPGECRRLRVTVPGHYVQTNRDQYCIGKTSDAAMTLDTKLHQQMQSFATSNAQDSIEVSTNAFAFWSSGVLSLTTPVPSTASSARPTNDFTFVVEVHDSKAPANVEMVTKFGLPYQFWKLPCPKRLSSIYVIGMVYDAAGEVVNEFDDTYRCEMFVTPMTKPIEKVPGAIVLVQSTFDTQVELRPGEYELRVVVSDGKNFGRASVPLRVRPLQAGALAISDLVTSSFLRDSSWVLRDAAAVSPTRLSQAHWSARKSSSFQRPMRLSRTVTLCRCISKFTSLCLRRTKLTSPTT